MLIKPIKLYRPRHRPAARAGQTPVPVSPLTLIAVAYEPGVAVELTFDRAIDIAGIVGGAIVVDDPTNTDALYHATGAATLVNPTTVEIGLVADGNPTGSSVRLTANAGNGIVAADDGVAWAGVSDVVIPFG